jgi:cell division protein FtsI/penicillin-binding protein 2
LFPVNDNAVLATQYTKTLANYYPRGNIYDRNGIPFTNRADDACFELPVSACDIDDVASYITGELSYIEGNTTESGCIGANGLQSAYDDILNGGNPMKVIAEVDAAGNIIDEQAVYVENDHVNAGCDITLTLDYVWQSKIEEVLASLCEESGYKGACAVLTEISTGKIIVMASYGDYMNKAVLSYQPGSVMKIVTAAAALETGLVTPETIYHCTGSVTVGGATKYCSGKTAHGAITFAQAFAHSCNCCFYETAKYLCVQNADGTYTSKAMELAVQWGFNIYGEDMEKEFLLDYDGHYSFVATVLFNDTNIFNVALGEGDVQASPYIINKITAAVAGGGSVTKPYIVAGIKDPAGADISIENNEVFQLGLSDTTDEALKNMMILCATEGTASNNTSAQYGGMGGKTGTAENVDGAECHAWFTGFFPAAEPEYALSVFIEEG